MCARAGISARRRVFCLNQFCWLLGLWTSRVDPNEIYPSGIIFKPRSHQITPASRQSTPDSFSPNDSKELYFRFLNVSLSFDVCGFSTQNVVKLLEYGNQPAGCVFDQNPIQRIILGCSRYRYKGPKSQRYFPMVIIQGYRVWEMSYLGVLNITFKYLLETISLIMLDID